MKKLFILLFTLVCGMTSLAQSQPEPNRILVTDKAGVTKGYVINYLEEMTFARVDGNVLAKVTVDDVSLNQMTLTIKMTPECRSYKLALITQTVADQLGNDANAIRYINTLPAESVPVLDEDFNRGTLSGIQLNADSKYSIITIGMDRYGIESGVYRADFETAAPNIVGNPNVTMEQTESTLSSFTVKFTPNSDVNQYWVLAGEAGTMQQQYEQFAAMFGFTNFSDMIRMWGIPTRGPSEHTWDDMAPNGTYDVFVAMTDRNDNFAPYRMSTATTLSLGGHGEARVAIEELGIDMSDWDGEMKPSEFIGYTPNDQAACYRCGLYRADIYDASKSEIQAELCSDPDQNYAYWFQYFYSEAEYLVDLNTNYVAIAAAKNIDGQWGPVTELRFKTPESVPGYAPARPSGMAPKARTQSHAARTQGVMPPLESIISKMKMSH